MPIPVAKAIASIGAGVSRVIRRPPLLPKGQLTYFLWQGRPDSTKAQRELGWRPTPLDEGRPEHAQRDGPARELLAEAADAREEPADSSGVDAVLVAMRAEQVGLLDRPHLKL